MQSIETFAVTVKEIAQLLQGFGSELSETELPDEANAIEFLLHSHSHRYRQMKVALTHRPSMSFFFSSTFHSSFFSKFSVHVALALCVFLVLSG